MHTKGPTLRAPYTCGSIPQHNTLQHQGSMEPMLGKMGLPGWQRLECSMFADGHTASNAPDLFRPPKLSGAGPGQYWGGGPPGKTLGCCQLLLTCNILHVAAAARSRLVGQTWFYNCHRSHFGSRYKLGCCGHAGLFFVRGSMPGCVTYCNMHNTLHGTNAR